ncbi:MAG: hypothetical protein F6J93_28840 [Oscillatoria sp. SIO1A7]|nr:hypothetical protein [Oscillatoria sp. SIO1A7]
MGCFALDTSHQARETLYFLELLNSVSFLSLVFPTPYTLHPTPGEALPSSRCFRRPA